MKGERHGGARRTAAVGAVTALIWCGDTGCQGGANTAENAYEDYEHGDYRASAEAYRDSLGARARSLGRQAAVRYNLGAALYRLNEHEASAAQFTQAAALASSDPRARRSGVEFRALYNLGNSHFRRADYEQAVSAYRGALAVNPEDDAAKHNLELALEELRRRPDVGGERDSESRQMTPESGQGAPTPVPEALVGLSAQEARRLLDMLGEDDLSAQQRRLQRTVPPRTASDRDW